MIYPPFAQPDLKPRVVSVAEGAADPPAEDDLPAIEQFIDELPLIDDYLSDEDPDGWAAAGWQSYDWSGLAALGRPHMDSPHTEASEADDAWSVAAAPVYSRGPAVPPSVSRGGPSAHEVAAALDGIARRIRSGELAIDQFRGTPPEAAIAAALAGLLRLRG